MHSKEYQEQQCQTNQKKSILINNSSTNQLLNHNNLTQVHSVKPELLRHRTWTQSQIEL